MHHINIAIPINYYQLHRHALTSTIMTTSWIRLSFIENYNMYIYVTRVWIHDDYEYTSVARINMSKHAKPTANTAITE